MHVVAAACGSAKAAVGGVGDSGVVDALRRVPRALEVVLGGGGAEKDVAAEAPTTIVQKQQFAGKSVLPARRPVAVVEDGGSAGEEVYYYINGIVEQGAMTVTTSTLLEA